ncbi:hypothetical protein Hanom_Chr05g00444621 [Helianthus anomalus]
MKLVSTSFKKCFPQAINDCMMLVKNTHLSCIRFVHMLDLFFFFFFFFFFTSSIVSYYNINTKST